MCFFSSLSRINKPLPTADKTVLHKGRYREWREELTLEGAPRADLHTPPPELPGVREELEREQTHMAWKAEGCQSRQQVEALLVYMKQM